MWLLEKFSKNSNKFRLFPLLLVVGFILGIASGDEIELQTYFNARYSANFLKSTKNIKTVLPPDTRAKVTEVKTMASGNLGLRVDVLNGKAKGQTVWVYYKKKNPRMKLYASNDGSGEEVMAEKTEVVNSVKTTRSVDGLSEPDWDPWIPGAAKSITPTTSVVKTVDKANSELQKLTPKCDNCTDAELEPGRRRFPSDPVRISPNATLNKPLAAMNTKKGIPTCQSRNGYDACTYSGDSAPAIFKIFNSGPNRIVSGSNFDRRREWSFYRPDFASQDLGFYVEDYNGTNFANSQRSYVMVFPRNTLPSLKVMGEEKIVTLPTGETVTFNQRTNEIISGALVETGKVGASSTPGFKYQGNGLMVRVNSVGVNEPKQASKATITKQGRTCQVPASELWNQSSASQMNFKFPKDSDFNKYLISRCGFGI